VSNLDSLRYDAYISCANSNEDWVQDWLRVRLERAGLRILTSYELQGGRYKVTNIEEAIQTSAHVLLVLTPQWVESEWKKFEGALAASDDPAATDRKIIPLLLQDCDIPAHLAFRQPRDFRRPAGRELQIRLLISDLLPPPTEMKQAPPTLGAKILSWVWRHPSQQRRQSLSC